MPTPPTPGRARAPVRPTRPTWPTPRPMPAPNAANQLAEAMEMLAPKVTKRLDQLRVGARRRGKSTRRRCSSSRSHA